MPNRRTVLVAPLAAAAILAAVPLAAQTVERRLYVASEGLKRDLAAHGIDSGPYEDAVNAAAASLSAGDLAPLLARSAPSLRVTAGHENVVLPKGSLGAYGQRLLEVPNLRLDVTDEDQVIIHDGQVGLARGTIWIGQKCLDGACAERASEIVTINLP